jgi:hypothetical protein
MASVAGLVVDVAEKIIADDWLQYESHDGSRSYYVIGADAYWEHVGTGPGRCEDYTPCFVGRQPKIGPLAEHAVRSQLAGGRRGEYLRRERKRLERAGVSAATIDRFLSGDIDDLAAIFPEAMPRGEALELVLPFLEAWRVSVGATTLDREEEQEVATAREKLCLREVARKYGKIVDRWEQLDPLPFDDPQLEEASKAYLYGFYRSGVVLSASALEGRLKQAAGDQKERGYSELVEDAAVSLGMNWAWIQQAKAVFRFRNRVVHDGYSPTHDEAGEVLCSARDLLTRTFRS